MDPAIVILSLTVLALGGIAIWLVWRLIDLGDKYGKEKDASREAIHRCQQCEAQYQTTAREFARYVERAKQVERDLKNDIGQLETELSTVRVPGAAKRRLERLLSEPIIPDPPATSTNDNGNPGLSSGGAAPAEPGKLPS